MVFKIALTVCIACIAALSLKKVNATISAAILIACTVIVSALILSHFVSAFDDISALFQISGLNTSYLKILVKCLGISLVAGLAADICEDAGYTSVVSQIMLAGKMSILLLCLPLFRSVLEICIGLIKG